MLLALITACTDIRYYGQAVKGQTHLLSQRVSVEQLIQDPTTSERLRNRLLYSREIIHFANETLHLNTGNAYQSYVDVKRPHVIYNLVAAPPLSLTPKTWCYPIIGCQSYRGFFDLDMAKATEKDLQSEGMETWLGGVSAYSTLGWFDDPLLNTFIYRDDVELAALLIHELSHRQIYIEGDTAFNESFATAVEQAGLALWLVKDKHEGLIQRHQQQYEQRQQFVDLISQTLEVLRKTYNSHASDDEKRQQKHKIIANMRAQHQQLKENWGGKSPYDRWFSSPINNAKLLTVSSYHQYVPGFLTMLHKADGNWPIFYQLVEELAKKPKAERDSILLITQP